MKLAPLRDSRFKLSKGSVISLDLKTLALDVTFTDPRISCSSGGGASGAF